MGGARDLDTRMGINSSGNAQPGDSIRAGNNSDPEAERAAHGAQFELGTAGQSVYNEVMGTVEQRKGKRRVQYPRGIRVVIWIALAIVFWAGLPGAADGATGSVPGEQPVQEPAPENPEPGDTAESGKAGESAATLRTAFEVRFIAQPQDRRLIPVTYLPTPESEAEVYPVLNEVLLTGRQVVAMEYEDLGEQGFAFRLKLNQDAAKRMSDVTEYGIGEQLALILDGQILFYPYVRDTIHEVIEVRGPVGKNKNHAQLLREWFTRLGN